MKKAFTLIELLVVIAIIAILAAILFPVFAQAKAAAKKTVSISNQKQMGLGFMMYLSDNEDIYPRRRGYENGSSINPALKGVVGNTNPNIVNYQVWQKYIMPYVKSVDLFFHPLRTKDPYHWNTNGFIVNGYALNLGITGMTNSTYTAVPWTGGSQTALPMPSGTMLLTELPTSQYVPWVTQLNSSPKDNYIVYPLASREFWKRNLFKTTGANNCGETEVVDPIGAPAGGVSVANADGSARFVTAGKFVGMSPTTAEYMGTGYPFPANSWTSNCRDGNTFTGAGGSATYRVEYTGGFATPNVNLNYPFWGFGG